MLRPKPADAVSNEFDMRPRKVRRWVAELPTADLAETSRRLHEALTKVSAQQTTTRRLYHFLEAVAPAAALVFPHLERQYWGQPLPLNEAGTRASTMAIEIRAGLLMGYRNVLRAIVPDKEEATKLRVFWYRRQLITVLHRFIHYGDGLLEIYRMLHNDPPDGLWRRIHRCYRLADKHKLARSKVRIHDEKGCRSSVEHAYVRLLLSALLPTGTIPIPQQREIDATFDCWARLVRLRPATGGLEGVQYLTRLARDCGPLATAEVGKEVFESENTCLMDTSRLCRTIATRRERGGKRRWWRRETDMMPETLTVLHDSWCTVHKRVETRVPIDIPAEVAVGLTTLFWLAGGRPASEGIALKRNEPIIAMEDKVEGGQWMGKTQNADVWKTVYDAEKVKAAAPTLPSATIVKAAVETEHTAVPGRLVDRSDHGLAVVIARGDLRQAAVGMPVAARTEDTDWMIGAIMRLKDRGEEVELGMRRLLNGAVPARLRVREGVRVSPYFDVVIGLTYDGRRAVAVPAVSALRSGDPDIELDGKTFPVGRGPAVLHSRYVDVFALELHPGGEALAAIEQAARNAAAAPRRPERRSEPVRDKAAAAPLDRETRVRQLMERTGLARADAEFIIEAETAAGPE